MSDFSLPLPSRAIAVAPRPFAMPAAFFFTVLILGAMAIGLAWWQGPGLWRDWRISQDPVVVDDWDMIDGECSSRRGLTDCEAHVTYTYGGAAYEKHITIAFLDFSSGDYLVELVVHRDDPDLATISLGLDMLWNRSAVFAVFMLLLGGGAIASVLGALRARSANRAAGQAGRLALVSVDVADVKDSARGPMVTYIDHPKGGRSQRTTRTQMARGQVPLMGLDEAGVARGLAVKLEHVPLPILLDAGLERLQIADTEREAALSAFTAEQERRGPMPAPQAAARKSVGATLGRGLMRVGGVLVLLVLGVFGYWVYYATTAGDAFDPVGIEINNLMPGPLNNWACEQLYARFGDERAPFGCVEDDFTSWTVAPTSTKTK